MPLRRRPRELSPRLLALLGVGPDPSQDGAAAQGSGGGGAALGPADEGWWTPSRAWLEVLPSRSRQGEGSGVAGEPDVAVPDAAVPDAAGSDTAVSDGPVPAGRHRAGSAPRLFTLPESLVGARVASSGRAVVGLLVVALVAAGIFGGRVLVARAQAEPRPVAPGEPAGSGSTPAALVARTAQPAGAATATTAAPGGGAEGVPVGTVVVHVVGQVVRPGLVTLPGGSRVSDAVAAAGGPTAGADVSAVNLARLVLDGEQLRVPKPGEAVAAVGVPAAGGSTGGGSATGGGGPGGQPVNLNTADLSGLDSLPGVGPVLAQRILDWRNEHGRFSSVDELGEVSGIGEKVMAQLQPLVTV